VVLTRAILNDPLSAFTRTCNDFNAEMVDFDEAGKHAHAQANHPLKVTMSALVNHLKIVSNCKNREKSYRVTARSWPPACLTVSCCYKTLECIRLHIEQQQTPH